ncbi:bifunctional diguanylate cyclase/phosphodiesterase [Methylotenera versatilis]|uniref:Diguanylate cyclase/phosphodiesterase n=1 Tax=Methylotenera versatilis (strain 301) TaxID=666681 RepID=D7DPG6_METV0|nr:EAL domain-containing protein [Methylotenera versatilis]ADI29210.1 diguanylate cyclase/phosphodiesterase [Methylotenera versatilis 301]
MSLDNPVTMSHYNIKLIVLSMLLGYFAVLLTFNLVGKLYKSQVNDKKSLLVYSSITVGSSLWVIHFIDVLAFPVIKSTGFTVIYLALAWLAALLFSAIVLHISSQKTLPANTLIIGGLIASISAYTIFYFSIASMEIQPAVTFTPLISSIALITTFSVTLLSILIFFWIKNYSGKYQLLTKSIFAVLTSLAITGVHLVYMASIEVPLNAYSVTNAQLDSTLLGVTIALGLICLFLAGFIVAIFYDKFGYDTFKFNPLKSENAQETSRLALVDTLTQLPNRRALMQHLEAATRRCDRNGASLAVAFIDVDNFKQINDTLGHQVGDLALQKVARRLVTAVRGCDEVARIGGDEFIAIIEEVDSYEDCITVIERMVSAVRESCTINHSEVHLSISAGVAIYPKDGNIQQLISAADTAMYRAKKDGKNQYRFFDSEIASAADHLLEMQHDLKNALANDELTLHYQIKIDSITREPVGAEALLRWNHPVKGLLYPGDFMLAADRFGLSYAISDWVIEESCRTLQQLTSLSIPFNISVNISHQQMINANLVSNINAMLSRYDLPKTSLIIEMTESTALKNQAIFNNQLARFKEAGIKVTLDDFGTYSSSLTNLQKWQVSELKLDPTFIEDIETNNRTRGVIQAVIELAHALDLNVVAEGIETEGQRVLLADLGCDEMQGYFISRPLPEERLISLLKNLDLNFTENGQLFFKELNET